MLVCDGHGGRQASCLVQENINLILLSCLQSLCKEEINEANLYFALDLTFNHLQEQVDEYLQGVSSEALGKGKGTTVNLMVQLGHYTWFANAGILAG